MIKVPFQSRLGKCLRETRKKRRLTQLELAEQASLSIPTLRLLEGGRGNLSSWGKALSALSLVVEGRNLPPGEDIGQRVAALRKRRHLSQRKLASMVGTTQPTIIALEKRSQGRLTVLDRALTVIGGGHYLAEHGTQKPFFTHAGNSSTSMMWHTPAEVLDVLYEAFGVFDLDPCSPTANRASAPVKASVHYTVADDGLSLPWHGVVFLNPPYGRGLGAWIAKAEAEVLRGNAHTVVALIPARTDTRYWHEHVAGNATVFFLRRRLTFGSAGAAAPFPSAIALWGATAHQVAALEQSLADAWVVPPATLPPTSPLPPPEPAETQKGQSRSGTQGRVAGSRRLLGRDVAQGRERVVQEAAE